MDTREDFDDVPLEGVKNIRLTPEEATALPDAHGMWPSKIIAKANKMENKSAEVLSPFPLSFCFSFFFLSLFPGPKYVQLALHRGCYSRLLLQFGANNQARRTDVDYHQLRLLLFWPPFPNHRIFPFPYG